MRPSRTTVVYALLCAVLGGTAGVAWIAATGTFRPPVWGIVASSTFIGVVCDPIARAVTRPRRPARRRAHARTTTTRRTP